MFGLNSQERLKFASTVLIAVLQNPRGTDYPCMAVALSMHSMASCCSQLNDGRASENHRSAFSPSCISRIQVEKDKKQRRALDLFLATSGDGRRQVEREEEEA